MDAWLGAPRCRIGIEGPADDGDDRPSVLRELPVARGYPSRATESKLRQDTGPMPASWSTTPRHSSTDISPGRTLPARDPQCPHRRLQARVSCVQWRRSIAGG